MASPIGFVVVTNRDPPQLARLADRLKALYGADAPIVVHHDFGQSALDPSILPAGVQLVRPHVSTGWGNWAWLEAVFAALRLLRATDGGPEYAVLLSGADYPVAPAARVLADLRGAGADAFLHGSRVRPFRRDPESAPPLGLAVNEGGPNQKVCYRRYFATTYRPLGVRLRVTSPLLAPLLSPFSRGFGCYAGEAWWTLGRRGVDALLGSLDARPDLVRWFAERELPAEAFVQTVLWNDRGLRVEPRNFRYVDWSTRQRHPRQLEPADVPALLASGAHFARKFAVDAPVLDQLDAALGLPPWRGGVSSTSRAGSL